jgi:hypothetical protein
MRTGSRGGDAGADWARDSLRCPVLERFADEELRIALRRRFAHPGPELVVLSDEMTRAHDA